MTTETMPATESTPAETADRTWFKGKPHVDPLLVEVTTIDSDGRTWSKTIDYHSQKGRRWLGAHCTWAFHHNAEVRSKRIW